MHRLRLHLLFTTWAQIMREVQIQPGGLNIPVHQSGVDSSSVPECVVRFGPQKVRVHGLDERKKPS